MISSVRLVQYSIRYSTSSRDSNGVTVRIIPETSPITVDWFSRNHHVLFEATRPESLGFYIRVRISERRDDSAVLLEVRIIQSRRTIMLYTVCTPVLRNRAPTYSWCFFLQQQRGTLRPFYPEESSIRDLELAERSPSLLSLLPTTRYIITPRGTL